MATTPLNAKPGEIAVRFFCQGLGDCILIALGREDGGTTRILVDCGVIVGTPDPQPLMKTIVQGIKDSCEGHLDVLIITHQHWDHCSGFEEAREVWETIQVGKVWTAWTEDPSDEYAADLRKSREARKARLAVEVSALAADEVADADLDLLAFLGVDGAEGDDDGSRINRAFNYALSKGAQTYWHPGEVASAKAKDGTLLPNDIDILFLGPPRNDQIKHPDDVAGRHTYRTPRVGLNLDEDGFGADEGIPPFERSFTIGFDELANVSQEITDDAARHDFRDGADQERINQSFDLLRRYFDPKDASAWRNLADAGSVADLALALDGDTNNTSLVFAIHHRKKGEYLLFAADAQVGNWLSWGDQKYDVNGEEVCIDQVLADTVLYKVGHHGSHNATLKDRGLEMMPAGRLSAFIPLNEAIAHRKRWAMPWPALYTALKEKAGPRIARSDADPDAGHEGFLPSEDQLENPCRPLYFEWRYSG